MIRVRPYVSADQEFVLSLAPRLAIGIAPWRDPQKMVVTARDWITGSIEQHGQKSMVFVAEDEWGERLGFASVSHNTHFTGEGQAYIGELTTSEAAEGRRCWQSPGTGLRAMGARPGLSDSLPGNRCCQ